ncbi:hypothetical protein VI03_27735 [Burkholderia vietnamiensis]|nr:hypothetical protein VI03_27735 [Burkholderia vietnamiensis]
MRITARESKKSPIARIRLARELHVAMNVHPNHPAASFHALDVLTIDVSECMTAAVVLTTAAEAKLGNECVPDVRFADKSRRTDRVHPLAEVIVVAVPRWKIANVEHPEIPQVLMLVEVFPAQRIVMGQPLVPAKCRSSFRHDWLLEG